MLPFTDITFPVLTKIFFINFIFLTLRYVFFSGIAFGIFWVWKKKYFEPHRIQSKFPKAQKIQSEIKYSISTFFIFALVGVGIYVARTTGYTKIYLSISDYGYMYFFFTIILSIVLHDAYFYFMHKLMHHKFLFKHVHMVHHNSINPSPFAAFSFHPLEAILEAGIVPLIVVSFPIHPLAILSLLLFMTALNVLGHLGYELYPSNFVRSKWTNWNNTSTHHNMHHQKFNCNYGLYFNWWDKLFNTNHESYSDEYTRITKNRDEILTSNKINSNSKLTHSL
jgi:sterol desaturase/sphingolipid hydroxylase (fatty acid hydroxylase superfamily)